MPSSFFTQRQLSHLYTSKQLSTYDIANKYGCDSKTVFYWLKKYRIPTRAKKTVFLKKDVLKGLYNSGLSLAKIGKRYHITASAVYRKMVYNNLSRRTPWAANIIHQRTPFSKDLTEKSYLIGFRTGDLYVKRNASSIIVKSNTTQKIQIELMKSLFSPYGPVWVSSSKTRKSVYHCTINLNKSFMFLVQKPTAIPQWIYRSNSNFWAFLSGYIDAEGTIRVYAKRARLRVGSYDKTILKQIHVRLSQLGIKNSFRLESLADGINRNGDFYRVDVMNRYALFSCLHKILPLLKHGRRRQDAQVALLNVTARI